MKTVSLLSALASIGLATVKANTVSCSWDPNQDFKLCVGNCGQHIRVLPDGETCKRSEQISVPLLRVPTITAIHGDMLIMDDPGENCDKIEAHCPEGTFATGGGWLRHSGDMEANVAFDGPLLDSNTGSPIGWTVRLEAEGGGSHMKVQAYAICLEF